MAVATLTFADRLAAEVERKRSQLVVGLDPNPDLLPVELRGDVARFCCGIVDAVAPHAVARQAAARVLRGARRRAGWPRSTQVCSYARRAGLLVIADGKRGDIGSTARAYAEAYLEGDPPRADALTVNPWLGRDADRAVPRRRAPRRRRHLRARAHLERGRRPAGRRCSRTAGRCGTTSRRSSTSGARSSTGEVGLSSVGAVVGATHPRAVAEARRLMPRTIFLLPGVGAQGGSVADLGRAFQSGPASALVSASRSVIYASARRGHRLPRGGGRRGVAAEARGLGRLRLVVRGDDWRRYVGSGRVPARSHDRDRARPLGHGRRRRRRHADRLRPDARASTVATTTTTKRTTTTTASAQAILDGSGRRHVRRHLDEDRRPRRDDRASQSRTCPRPRSSSARRSGCE